MVLNDKAQLHTLEGLIAAVLMTMTILSITQSTAIVTPQNELAIDVQLEQISSDALRVLDVVPESSNIRNNLTECVASWNKTEASYPDYNLELLEINLENLMPDLLYNVDFAYVENDSVEVRKVIINGQPADNSVAVRHFVTLTNDTVQTMNGSWTLADDEIKVVEIRMITWKV